jgi:toxin ParE1/3/4
MRSGVNRAHNLAEREPNDAAAYYYAQERPGLGEAFLALLPRGLSIS